MLTHFVIYADYGGVILPLKYCIMQIYAHLDFKVIVASSICLSVWELLFCKPLGYIDKVEFAD